MSLSTRITLLLFFFSLCLGGAILAPEKDLKTDPPKTKLVPVKNPNALRHIWLWA